MTRGVEDIGVGDDRGVMTHEEKGKIRESGKGKITKGGKREIQNNCMGREDRR
jgi:hypothetical protein